ncbi:MAG: hypothetical protein EPO01_07685 [Aquabacterium sp.]|nr:MAG: hypothetical protein EPO01_07685 [Aquabacterium sp.]
MSPSFAPGPSRRRAPMQYTLASVLCCAAAASPAATIVENQPTSFTAVTLADSSLSTGTLLEQTSGSFQTTQFCCAGFSWSVNGTITTKVVRDDDGTVDFYWQVETAIADYSYGGSPSTPFPQAWGISDLYLRGFYHPGTSFEAGYVADGDGQWAPGSAIVHDAGYPDWLVPYSNGTIDITIDPKTGKSKWFFLDTNAHGYAPGAGISAYGPIEWRLGSQEVSSFAPTHMPEPAAWLMLLPGLALIGRMAARRR